jgi:hypothetical protein
VDAEVAFQQLRTRGRFAASGVPGGAEGTGAESSGEDDSPTLMLPADMVLDSRMHDDAAESESESETASRTS